MDAQAVAEKTCDVMLADDAASRMLGMQVIEVAPGRAVATMEQCLGRELGAAEIEEVMDRLEAAFRASCPGPVAEVRT